MKPNQFKQIRLKAGFSQAKIAMLLKVSHGTVSNWEKGYRPIPEDIVKKMESYKWEQWQEKK